MGKAAENGVSAEKEAFIHIFSLQRAELTKLPSAFFCCSE